MAIYELTLRFEAEDDLDALTFGGVWEQGIEKMAEGIYRKLAIERVTKVVVTHMPLNTEQVRQAGEPC